MVLQSKVFLAVLMQRTSPFLSKKRTFIRKVKEKLSYISPSKSEDSAETADKFFDEAARDLSLYDNVRDTPTSQPEMTQTEAMRLFKKIPFPEPRRVINVKQRKDVKNNVCLPDQ